jgi:hypothetical protein
MSLESVSSPWAREPCAPIAWTSVEYRRRTASATCSATTNRGLYRVGECGTPFIVCRRTVQRGRFRSVARLQSEDAQMAASGAPFVVGVAGPDIEQFRMKPVPFVAVDQPCPHVDYATA